VAQETRVFVLDGAAAARLEQALRAGLPTDADWRPAPHARFSVRTGSLVVTCYRSGKVVLQGVGVGDFVARYLPHAKAAAPPGMSDIPRDVATIGQDESGKGDYFGPLVVAGVFAEPERFRWLEDAGVADSKQLPDSRVRTLAGLIERELPFEVAELDPASYNAAHARVGNLNLLLTELHVRVAEAMLERGVPARQIVVDRFADEALVAKGLARRLAGEGQPRLIQVPRAESHPVVAAASVVARARFLDGLVRCSDLCGTDLHKGAGAVVDELAARVLAIGGRALLGRVAKLHFKNTSRVESRERAK
jgi:ribonuclease HIII